MLEKSGLIDILDMVGYFLRFKKWKFNNHNIENLFVVDFLK